MEAIEHRKMAEVEDAMWYYRALHGHFLRALRMNFSPGGQTVLDAGCGTGGLIRNLARAEPRLTLTGVDISPVGIELARERSPDGARFEIASVASLPFQNESFDAITSADVLCQIENPVAALAEFYRCLRPGGLVFLNMPAYAWLYSYHDAAVGNLRRYTRRELAGLLAAARFKFLGGTYWNTLPFPLVVAQRKIFSRRQQSSDVRLYPAPLEAMLKATMFLESCWLRTGARLPFGCAVFVVARKPT